MNTLYINYIADKLGVKAWRVENCIKLLEEGATVPFISRYRKEATGTMTDVEVAETNFHYQRFQELDKRKEAILASIEQQQKLTPELKTLIEESVESQRLEDLYLPYRPKRRTRASIARDRGLEPLADRMLELGFMDVQKEAQKFIGKDVPSPEAALQGARDIIAEQISENIEIRQELRGYYSRTGILKTKVVKGKEEEGEKYADYFGYSANLSKMPSHRVLAILRAENEKIISVKVETDPQTSLKIINYNFYKGRKYPSRELFEQLKLAQEDALTRLLDPSIENETLKAAKERADLEAVKIFGDNLKQLLLAAPVGQKRTMALDPGFRTGCKVVCLGNEGELLHHDVIFPHPPVNQKMEAMTKITSMVNDYGIEVIAIGNGTAARETEGFIRRLGFDHPVKIYSVSEDGASIYSASETAREEFPDQDVTVRGAVSIGRRLMDPLAELVKIDPKSLGIGQYQHDVDQTLLKQKLDDVVEYCVNTVGVNLNTASRHLLGYVSGIGPVLAANIVNYRAVHGAFSSRKDLLEVPRLGQKAYQMAAGFLRIPGAANPLDNSAVHPERYALVEKMATDAGCKVEELIGNSQKIDQIPLDSYVSEDVGLPTLKDISQELRKPGRDPRESVRDFEFSQEISTIEDLREGMELPGIVTNLTAFGAFVDIGIKQNGLIHISNMGRKFVRNASDVLKLHQQIKVSVINVDLKRERIGLRLIGD